MLYLILLACIVRFWGITYGLPAVYNSTEYFIAKHALSLGARKTLEPLYFIYPTFYVYSIAALYGLYFGIGYLTGIFAGPEDFALQFLIAPTSFYLLGRIFNAFIFVIGLIIFYRTLRYFLSLKYAFVYTLPLLFSYTVQFYTRWMVPDAYLVTGTISVLYFIVRWNYSPITPWQILGAGLIAGLTVSSKYNAGFLPLGLLTAIILLPYPIVQKMRFTALGVFSVFLGFILGTPYWIVRFERFWSGFKALLSQSQYDVSQNAGLPFIWIVQKLLTSELLLGVALMIVLFWSLIRFRTHYLPYLIIILPTLIFVGGWNKQGLDYVLIVFPVLFLLTSKVVHDCKFHQKKFFTIFAIIILVPSILHVVYLDFLQSQKDTRELASQWIMQHVHPGTRICYDHFHYDLHLVDIERFTRYGKGARYLSPAVQEKLKNQENSPRNYRFIPLAEPTDDPIWPVGWDSSKIASFVEDSFIVNQLKFRMKDLKQLKNEGVEYLILNGDTYRKYLELSPPPEYNPLRENFLKRKKLYSELLTNHQPVAQFLPDWNTPGPIILIFHLN